jgi:hypothetical protein
VFQIIIYSILFSIGIWESTIASSNQHLYKVKSDEIDAYIYTRIKSIINIITSIIGTCLTCISNNESSKFNAIHLYMINLGFSIWSIIMYTNMAIDSSIRKY